MMNPLASRRLVLAVVLVLAVLWLLRGVSPRGTSSSLSNDRGKGGALRVLTWNVAAVNNNPFEYWITGPEEYNRMMKHIADFIEEPGDKDVGVGEVFTPAMWDALRQDMEKVGWEGVEKVDRMYHNDFKTRRIVTDFLKDKKIGKKRLASMPDRVTNTIRTDSGPEYRPAVINCYSGPSIATVAKWWPEWRRFVFEKEVQVKGKAKRVFKMLKAIKRAKYPAVTEEEERLSLPLQTLAGAIFDAILVHMMQSASSRWEALRETMCAKLNRGKNRRIVDILSTTYPEYDVMFLQEVASDLIPLLKRSFPEHIVHVPAKFDADRNQNSVILTAQGWKGSEVTTDVLPLLDKEAPVADGDLLVLEGSWRGDPHVLASFHGDTNGLASIPVVSAVREYQEKLPTQHKLVFGLDANTHATPKKDQQGLEHFAQFYVSKGLTSCYGENPSPTNYTTFHARTHLQTQLNKAVPFSERGKKGDKNPKDHILFARGDYLLLSTSKDNTGRRVYTEDMVFPTLDFPSDHGITSALLRPL